MEFKASVFATAKPGAYKLTSKIFRRKTTFGLIFSVRHRVFIAKTQQINT